LDGSLILVRLQRSLDSSGQSAHLTLPSVPYVFGHGAHLFVMYTIMTTCAYWYGVVLDDDSILLRSRSRHFAPDVAHW